MLLKINNYRPLDLPGGLCAPPGTFTGETPYLTKLVSRLRLPNYRNKKLPAKIACLEFLKARLGPYASYSEPMAGVGLSALIFGQGKELHLNDLDDKCREVIWRNFGVAATGHDISLAPAQPAGLIFADFNNLTLKRAAGAYKPALDKVFADARRYVILNDCSIFYLRYGESSYKAYSRLLGAPMSTSQDFLILLARFYKKSYPGWAVTAISYFRDSSFILLERAEEIKDLHEVTEDEIAAVKVIVEG